MFPWKSKPTELETVFEALGSSDSDKRYQALVEAQALPPERIAELVVVATQKENRSFQLNKTKIAAALIFVTGELLDLHGLFLVFPMFVCIYIMQLQRNRSTANHQFENMIRVVENAEDRLCVESVLRLLGSAKGARRYRLYRLLLQRLPELRADDSRDWTGRQKEPIKVLLRTWYRHRDLAFCILKAMPEIGGSWALETVEQLAKLKSGSAPDRYKGYWAFQQGMHEEAGWNGDMEPKRSETDDTVNTYRRIGEAAAACLPRLRERVQEEEAARVLLRAATPGNSAEVLLRPAGEKGSQTDTTTLLRPGLQASISPEESAAINGH